MTLNKLQRHFSGRSVRHLLGLHCRCPEGTSRWFGIDIDLHEDPQHPEFAARARRNHAAAVAWYLKLQSLGYDPILFDSNGAGGYHIWTLIAEPCPTPAVFDFANGVVSDWREHQLDGAPEVFPKNDGRVLRDPRTGQEKMGTWFRLPGRHHTEKHFARVWSGEPWLDDPWLAGNAAIDVMLETRSGPAP